MLELLTRNRWWLFVRGAAALVFGVAALLWPDMTLLALIVLYALYALVDGAATLMLVFRGPRRAGAGAWSLAVLGFGTVGLGIQMFPWAFYVAYERPHVAVAALWLLVAIWSIARGALELIAAHRLRMELPGEWRLGLAGILSLVFGVAVLFEAGAALRVYVWSAAIYVIATGILYIALGLRLGRTAPRLRPARAA